jgi:hypothetical protein
MYQKVKDAYQQNDLRQLDYWLYCINRSVFDDLMHEKKRPEFFIGACSDFHSAILLAKCYEHRNDEYVPTAQDITEFVFSHLGMVDSHVSVIDKYFESLPKNEPANRYFHTINKIQGIEKQMMYIDLLYGLNHHIESGEVFHKTGAEFAQEIHRDLGLTFDFEME